MITDFRINEKGELEGKVIPPAKWEEMYTKDEVVAMLTDLQLKIEEKKFVESSCSFMDKAEEVNYAVYTDDISKIIQQKISEIRGEQ